MICPHGHDEGVIERLATPEEVDAGCELGLAYDPCPGCERDADALRPEPDTLLGVPDFDFEEQAETGQGPPA